MNTPKKLGNIIIKNDAKPQPEPKKLSELIKQPAQEKPKLSDIRRPIPGVQQT